MPSGSNTRSLSTSASGAPVTRSMRMPATVAPVVYRQRSPGWSISGSDPSAAIHSSGLWRVGGHGGPSVLRSSAASAWTIGRVSGVKMHPKPSRNESTSSTVIARLAGTVSDSCASHARSTCRPASSGSHFSTGSDSAMALSSSSSIAATPTIGLVRDAIRKMASRPIGALSPKDLCPAVVTWTSPPRATSAISPGTAPDATCPAIARSSAASPSSVNPPVPMSRLPPLDPPAGIVTCQRAQIHRQAAGNLYQST